MDKDIQEKFDPLVSVVIVGEPPVQIYICETKEYLDQVWKQLQAEGAYFRVAGGAMREVPDPEPPNYTRDLREGYSS